MILFSIVISYLLLGLGKVSADLSARPIHRPLWALKPTARMAILVALTWPLGSLRRSPRQDARGTAFGLVGVVGLWLVAGAAVWACLAVPGLATNNLIVHIGVSAALIIFVLPIILPILSIIATPLVLILCLPLEVFFPLRAEKLDHEHVRPPLRNVEAAPQNPSASRALQSVRMALELAAQSDEPIDELRNLLKIAVSASALSQTLGDNRLRDDGALLIAREIAIASGTDEEFTDRWERHQMAESDENEIDMGPNPAPPPRPLPIIIWILPAILLAVAVLNLPYNYYTMMRWVVSLAACFIAWRLYMRGGRLVFTSVLFAAVAILFNPIAPMHFERETWAVFNVAGAAVFVMGAIVQRAHRGRSTR